MSWGRPTICPRGLSREQWMALPEHLVLRVIRFHTQVSGFRSRTILVATTLLDANAYPLQEIAGLYGDRWIVQLRLSLAGTVERLDALAPYLWLHAGSRRARVLYELLLEWIARDKIACRPHRIELWAVKRRPKKHARLNKPRHQLRQALLRRTA